MNKARSIKIIYIIAALALLVGMLPMTAVSVSAAPAITMNLVDPITGAVNGTDSGYNVTGSRVSVTATFDAPQVVASWSKLDLVAGTNSAWVGADPNTVVPVPSTVVVQGVWGETMIQATSNTGVVVSVDKKWGQIASSSFTTVPPGPNTSYVTWNEQTKSFSGGFAVTDTILGNFLQKDTDPRFPFTHTVQGVIMNWYLIDGAVAVDMTAGEAPALKTRMAGYLAARFSRFAGNGTFTQTVSNGAGQGTVAITTTGEEAIKLVVVPEYPGSVPQIAVTPEIMSWNFMTREMEVVPQVRWAGEKIVLEKNFGKVFTTEPNATVGYVVKFSLENQSGGALSAIGPTANNFSANTTQTVWTYVDANGLASCVLENQSQGECDVTVSLYYYSQGVVTLENQHGFVVYFLKFESLTLGDVTGKRAGHYQGDWTPANPWDASLDHTSQTLNVSQDALMRAQVKGWFTNANPSTRPQGVVDIGGTVGLVLPEGRWVLPDDWANLAGPSNWQERRIHWDIMSAPNDGKTYSKNTAQLGLGDYTQGTKVVAAYPVVGPFSPGIELMTPTGWLVPNPRPDSLRPYQTVVPNGDLNAWDAPMPPAKIIFEIMNGNGFFKSAYKTEIYYLMQGTAPNTTKVYTNPFYQAMIPAHEAIPAFINNGGYDWDTFGTTTPKNPYGNYFFWKAINQPNGIVATADQAGHPTKVEVYSDNHGEAMVYLNGDWNLNLMQFLSNGAADVLPGATVGTTTVQAWADYPYLRVHQAIFSNQDVKTWTWGGMVLGVDGNHQFPPTNATTGSLPMILSTGTYTIQGGTYPNEWGTSDKKMLFVWVTDRDALQKGVLGAKVEWNIAVSSGSAPIISGMNTTVGAGVSNYNEVTQNLALTAGFLTGTNGSLTGSLDGHQGVSYLISPSNSFLLSTGPWAGKTVLEALFYKFYNPTMSPTGLQPGNFAVAAIEVRNVGGSTSFPPFNVNELITSTDFGMQPGMTGTVMYNTNVDPSVGYAIDDAPKYGDANVDGVVNMGDVTKIERVILGLDIANVNADANYNGSIDMGDVVRVERTILGLK